MNVPEMMKVKLESSLESRIINLVATDYSMIAGRKVREMFAQDMVRLVRDQLRDYDTLDVGQVMWFGVAVDDKPSYGKNAYQTKLVPIVLTLVSKEDLEMRVNGYSAREVREYVIVRLFREAYHQGALLSNIDVATLVGVSPATISKQAREFMEREQVVLPTRGTIHDLGMATTHKRIIIRLYLRGFLTPEISRLTGHSEEAIDRYIRAFERVRLLRAHTPVYFSRATGMSHWLVNSYLNILTEFETDEVSHHA